MLIQYIISKNIHLNADDFGMSKEINDGIILLAELGVVKLVSVLINGPAINSTDIKKLLELKKNGLKIGIHFDLTEFKPLSKKIPIGCFDGLAHLIFTVFNNKLNNGEVIVELNHQLNQFESLFNSLPDHIDSHQHIHQIPILDNLFLEVIRSNKLEDKALRNTHYHFKKNKIFQLSPSNAFKIIIMSLLGKRLKRKLQQYKINTNTNFGGIYILNNTSIYKTIFEFYCESTEGEILFVIHPELPKNINQLDNQWRINEFNFLKNISFKIN